VKEEGMARLIVEAVNAEWTSGDIFDIVLIAVSVSRADDGTPVTGLTRDNFRVASTIGTALDATVHQVDERRWEPDDAEPAGCYSLMVRLQGGYTPGTRYVYGVQARTFGAGGPPDAVDEGQTIIELISTGI
jgi:hypothetical protein